MKRIAILISNKGTGTNLQAIIDAIQNQNLNAKIVVAIADTKDSPGLERTKNNNIPITICAKKEDLLKAVQSYPLDFICLAGWKQFIPDDFITAYPNKILNLHPGLIPDSLATTVKNPDNTDALWNKGKLTEKAMQQFLQSHATYAGSSIHFLTHEFDFGPVLGRCFEKIDGHDTVDTLYARLKIKENQLYVDVLKTLCNK